MFRACITVWQWAEGPAAKTYFVADGRLEKATPRMRDGTAEVLNATLAHIAAMASGKFNRPAVLLYGLPYAETPCVLASTDTAIRAEWRPERIFSKVDPSWAVITRSLEHFHRPGGQAGYLLIDCDLRGKPLATVLEWLFETCPEMRLAPMVAFPSGSGFVALEGCTPTPAGWHIVVGIQDASDAARAIGVLFERCFLIDGAHWAEVSESGAIIHKAIVDRALRNIIQPHFLQPPVLGEGVIRDAPAPVIRNPDAPGLDTREACREPTPEEAARISAARELDAVAAEPAAAVVREQRAKARAEKAYAAGLAPDLETAMADALRSVESELGGMLDWHQPLHFDRHGWVLPETIFANPEKFDGARMADPVEPGYCGTGGRPGRNKAVLQIDGRRAIISSLAHSDGSRARTYILDVDVHEFMSAEFVDLPGDADGGPETPSEQDLAAAGVRGARGLHEGGALNNAGGVLDVDLEGAISVLTTRRRTLLKLPRVVSASSAPPSVGGLITHALANGVTTAAVVYGAPGTAIEEAIAISVDERLSTRVDIYGGAQVPGAFPVVPRSKGCLKPKALKAVREYAPRSIAPIICKLSTPTSFVECEHFGTCPVIASNRAAQMQNLVQLPGYSARSPANALLEEHAGPVGLFLETSAAANISAIPLEDVADCGGFFADAALALANPLTDPETALMALKPNDLSFLAVAAASHNISANPATPEDQVVEAVMRARSAGRANATPPHIVAGVLLEFFEGSRAVMVKRDARTGPIAYFTGLPGLGRAADHQVAIAFSPVPIEAADTAAACFALFRKPSIAIPGNPPDVGPIIQAFDAKADAFTSPRERRAAAVSLARALMGAGLTPAVLTDIPGKGAPGIAIRSTKDTPDKGTDVIIWADLLSASDIDVARMMAIAGHTPRPFAFEHAKFMRWTRMDGEQFAAAGFRPSNEWVYRAWAAVAWAPVARALEGQEAAVIVMSDLACPWPVHALLGLDDLLFDETPKAIYAAIRIAGESLAGEALEAAASRMGVEMTDDLAHAVLGVSSQREDARRGFDRLAEALKDAKPRRNA